MEVWHGNFGCKKDIEDAFEVEFDGDVIYAEYDVGGYEGDAEVIYIHDGKIHHVTGSHCSCYGLEGQWTPEVISFEEAMGVGYLPETAKENIREYFGPIRAVVP